MNTTMIFVSEIEERNENEGLCVLTVNDPGIGSLVQRIVIVAEELTLNHLKC